MSEVGGPKLGLMNIGEEAKPPYTVLPEPASLFLARSKRFAALSPGHELGPYLGFLAQLTRAQYDILSELPAASLPGFDRIGEALEHGMPPVSSALLEPDSIVQATIDRLLDRLAVADVPSQTAAAIAALRSTDARERMQIASAALKDAPTEDVAQRVLVAAGLQVHFARIAALLDADDLKPVADGACPVCGSPPMTSSVVGCPKPHNTRFCTCSACGTMWNVVRVKCVLCGTTAGIGYHTVEGKSDGVKAESCDSCGRYVKILYQVNDPALDPLADDVATLGLDMLMAEDGWQRGGHNPFLLGY